jgi:hypothetical protein
MAAGRVWLVLVGVGVLLAGTPAIVRADHCGADGLVAPTSGMAGTAFVITPQLGSPTDLRLYRDGRLVGKVYLADGGVHTFIAKPGDEGRWEARAWLRSQPECRSMMGFAVLPLPDTATADPRPGASLGQLLAALASLLALAAATAWTLRRRFVAP